MLGLISCIDKFLHLFGHPGSLNSVHFLSTGLDCKVGENTRASTDIHDRLSFEAFITVPGNGRVIGGRAHSVLQHVCETRRQGLGGA